MTMNELPSDLFNDFDLASSSDTRSHAVGSSPSNANLHGSTNSSTNIGGSSGKLRKKRTNHNELERKRRHHQREVLYQLRDIIPSLQMIKPSTVLIMQKAKDYIDLLRRTIQEMEMEINELRQVLMTSGYHFPSAAAAAAAAAGGMANYSTNGLGIVGSGNNGSNGGGSAGNPILGTNQQAGSGSNGNGCNTGNSNGLFSVDPLSVKSLLRASNNMSEGMNVSRDCTSDYGNKLFQTSHQAVTDVASVAAASQCALRCINANSGGNGGGMSRSNFQGTMHRYSTADDPRYIGMDMNMDASDYMSQHFQIGLNGLSSSLNQQTVSENNSEIDFTSSNLNH